MRERTITTRSRQFLREYRRFKEFAAQGGKVNITDRTGRQFIFMRVVQKQHPPRQSEQGLDSAAFVGIDLDVPAMAPNSWDAQQ